VDATAAPGDELCYIVRTVASTDPLIESADSEESCLNVHDANPPAAPVGVAAQVRPDGIEISWSPSPEPDVAFYRVYRQAQGARKQIAQVPVRELVYVDAGAPVGVAERYFVTAVDKAGNESQRSAPASATRR
jgi:fibronectin type 3 domain-containing protein